ncbi:MAG: DUF2934 domain-containing protein [Chloroflexi bacterium]|nr:DUF2934 domain-containing protein [Chloroflexota bacterium]
MITEEEVKRLARCIWEVEGCPDGKHLDHYFRAKRMLEQRERACAHINKLRPHPPGWPVGAPPSRKERL